MSIQEQAYGDGITTTGYLYDWCRRTPGVGIANAANYFVETDLDGSTGRPI